MKPLLRLGGSRKAYALVWPLTTDLPDKLSGMFFTQGLDRWNRLEIADEFSLLDQVECQPPKGLRSLSRERER
jgi:hypothetical protein